MLELIDFNLEFYSTFAFEVVRFEQLKLQLVALLAQIFAFFPQFAFSLLPIKQHNLEFTDFPLEQLDTLIQESFRSSNFLPLLAQLLGVPLFYVWLKLLDQLVVVCSAFSLRRATSFFILFDSWSFSQCSSFCLAKSDALSSAIYLSLSSAFAKDYSLESSWSARSRS